MIVQGDCIEIMRDMEADSVDAIVTDPPYALSFMSKSWDTFKNPHSFQTWTQEWATEAFRVLKPGGHMLSFGGTRTAHRMFSGIEDAGFEIRDTIMWLHSLGFPKSFNIGKHVEGYEGYGTNLKPSYEPIVLARKPIQGTIIKNVEAYGTGGLNIDSTRISASDQTQFAKNWDRKQSIAAEEGRVAMRGGLKTIDLNEYTPQGRWPANTVFSHTEKCQIVDTQDVKAHVINRFNIWECAEHCPVGLLNHQQEKASRFFYCSKAAPKERHAGVEGKNNHSTVKPIELMRYLVRLVTPPNGVVLDPFLGSGTTAIACIHEGFDCIGIELEAEYMRIAEQRVAYWREKINGNRQ